MSTRPLAFSVTGLTKRYNGVTVLREVGFTVPVGTTAALVGPPGSGKSTLVEILLGQTTPTTGSAAIGGPGTGVSAGRSLGALLQPRGLHPLRTVRGHLLVYAAAAGVSDDEVDTILATTRLESVAGTKVRALPPGVQTRLALAIALLGNPPLLILDDPLTGLDAPERAWLFDHLHRHARRGGATLLTTQSLSAVLPVADNLILLGSGSVVFQGSPRALRRNHPDRLVVAASSPIALATMLAAQGFTDAVMRSDGRLAIAEATRAEIEVAAGRARVRLLEVIPEPVHPDRVLAALTRTAPMRSQNDPAPSSGQYGSVPAQRGSAAQYGFTPAQGGSTPAHGNPAPVRYSSTPSQGNPAPPQYGSAPAQGGPAPVRYGSTPAQGNPTPTQYRSTPTQYGSATAPWEDRPTQGGMPR
jgi:ABC-2 type transport system ATP-binding protein